MTAAKKLMLAACAVAAAIGCGQDASTATQVIVSIEAERDIRRSTAQVRIAVEDTDGAIVLDEQVEPSFPIKLVLAPRGDDATRTYAVLAEALDDDDKAIARVRFSSGYVEDQKRFIRLVFEDECAQMLSCGTDQTCHSGECASAQIAPDDLGRDRNDTPDLGELATQPMDTDAGACAVYNGGCDELVACSASGCGPCPEGYDDTRGDGTDCVDIDECDDDNGGCGDAAFNRCVNMEGAAPRCEDIDECSDDNGGCGDAAFVRCVDKIGAAPECVDIDECVNDNGGCGGADVMRCVDMPETPPDCEDIDDCEDDNGGCGDPAFIRCVNKQAAPRVCEDINECEDDNGGCDQVCKNAEGSYSCECLPGSTLEEDDRSCHTPKWSNPSLIETDNSGDAASPQVALNASGSAIAVWQQSNGTRTDIWANRLVFDSGWEAATRIESNDTSDARDPRIAIDRIGDAVALFVLSGTRSDVYFSKYTVGHGWSFQSRVDNDDVRQTTKPSIAVDGSGNAVALWFSGSSVWGNRWIKGSGWTSYTPLQIGNSGNAAAKITVDEAGNALAVGYDYGGSLWFNRLTPDGGWGGVMSASKSAGEPAALDLVTGKDGSTLAVWGVYANATGNSLLATRFSVDEGWTTPVPLPLELSSLAGSPRAAIDENGNAIAIWSQSDGTRSSIWARHFSVDTGWGTPETVELNDSGDAQTPDIAMDSSGNALSVWCESDGVRNNLWANRFISGIGWGTAALVETDNAGDVAAPQVEVDGSGRAVVVWVQNDGTRNNIWAARFE